MKKPLSITSPDHGIALAMYFMLGFGGLGLILNKTSGSAARMVSTYGLMVTDIWAVTLMICGFTAFFAAVAAKYSPRPEHNLWAEMYACIGLFFNLGFFIHLVLTTIGVGSIAFLLPFFIGSGFRALQIFLEQRLIRKARLHPRQSDPMLADPRDDDKI